MSEDHTLEVLMSEDRATEEEGFQ